MRLDMQYQMEMKRKIKLNLWDIAALLVHLTWSSSSDDQSDLVDIQDRPNGPDADQNADTKALAKEVDEIRLLANR